MLFKKKDIPRSQYLNMKISASTQKRMPGRLPSPVPRLPGPGHGRRQRPRTPKEIQDVHEVGDDVTDSAHHDDRGRAEEIRSLARSGD